MKKYILNVNYNVSSIHDTQEEAIIECLRFVKNNKVKDLLFSVELQDIDDIDDAVE